MHLIDGVGGNASWFADIGEAWAATGYDPTQHVKDPLCQLYSDQFQKVQDALWKSKFPDYEKYFPYANNEKQPSVVDNQTPPPASPTQEEQERLLEMYIEKGETPKAPSSRGRNSKVNKENKADVKKQHQRSPILELLLFVVCGLFFILLLDLFFRMGYTMGKRAHML